MCFLGVEFKIELRYFQSLGISEMILLIKLREFTRGIYFKKKRIGPLNKCRKIFLNIKLYYYYEKNIPQFSSD